MHLSVAHDFLPKSNSTRASLVMDHFGIAFETGQHVIAENLCLPVERGQVVLFTGASGSGKSSLMRAASSQLRAVADADGQTLINIDDLVLGERLLIDTLPLPVDESLQLLAVCGLGEAHLMLRTPAELSDGQRYRFRLALALAQRPQWILADEFTATLDRTLARVVAFNIRRLADRTGTGFLLATTHEDVAEDLAPDLHVRCRLDGAISITGPQSDPPPDDQADNPGPRKKKDRSASPPVCGSPPPPRPTGRTSLGGITGVIMSG